MSIGSPIDRCFEWNVTPISHSCCWQRSSSKAQGALRKGSLKLPLLLHSDESRIRFDIFGSGTSDLPPDSVSPRMLEFQTQE